MYPNRICNNRLKSDSWGSGKSTQVLEAGKFLGFHLQITGLVISVIFYDNTGSQRRGFLLITSIQT